MEVPIIQAKLNLVYIWICHKLTSWFHTPLLLSGFSTIIALNLASFFFFLHKFTEYKAEAQFKVDFYWVRLIKKRGSKKCLLWRYVRQIALDRKLEELKINSPGAETPGQELTPYERNTKEMMMIWRCEDDMAGASC